MKGTRPCKPTSDYNNITTSFVMLLEDILQGAMVLELGPWKVSLKLKSYCPSRGGGLVLVLIHDHKRCYLKILQLSRLEGIYAII